MTTFAQAVNNQLTTTTNAMPAYQKTGNANVDLFFKIAAARNMNIIPTFVAAFVENPDLAIRTTLWSRDVLQGAGERRTFKRILNYLEQHDLETCKRVLNKIPDLGRMDDGYELLLDPARLYWFDIVKRELENKNALAAKWTPREKSSKKKLAKELRNFLKLSAKEYRKLIADLSTTVEDQMCANQWDDINFNHVPSVASARYRAAFHRHTPKYEEYVMKLKAGNPEVKVNAQAVFPHDVIKSVIKSEYVERLNQTEYDFVESQWNSLPNYITDANVLPIVDVSGSMTCKVGNNPNLTCLQIAVSLGLYFADKNTDTFKDIFMTFSENPRLMRLEGTIIQKLNQLVQSEWEMNTNLEAALNLLLKTGIDANVPDENMPKMLLLLSDMQFDRCVANGNESAINMMRTRYAEMGYTMPTVIFWNLNAHDNVPVRFNDSGVALISGFSPAIMKTILSADLNNLTPEAIMISTVMNDRYRW